MEEFVNKMNAEKFQELLACCQLSGELTVVFREDGVIEIWEAGYPAEDGALLVRIVEEECSCSWGCEECYDSSWEKGEHESQE